MPKESNQILKTGMLVASGTAFLIILLYLVGKNEHLFGTGFSLRARFSHVQGLKEGNNVRYAGIDLGTVRSIQLLNDSMVEVNMRMNRKLHGVLLKNSTVSIGTDGLVGNKVVNISHGRSPSQPAENGDLLPSVKPVDTDKMLATLDQSNQSLKEIFKNIEVITGDLKSARGWKKWIDDTSIHQKIYSSATQVNLFTQKMNKSGELLEQTLNNIRNEKGVLGKLISDSIWANKTEKVIDDLDNSIMILQEGIVLSQQTINDLKRNIDSGRGALALLLNDSIVANDMKSGIRHLQQSGILLEESLKALQQNILLRGYFRKKRKSKINAGSDDGH
jgi:phospholipid/cholesterol/gamma-HCH transport system substrate-binding protein